MLARLTISGYAVAEAKMHDISREQAVRIAAEDARRVYHDLSDYDVEAKREKDGWHIDYDLKNRQMNGGGPHYVIDATDGHIISKRYDQ